MMKFNVKLDIQRARRSLQLEAKEVNKGAARALQRVATTVRKEADQGIRQTLAVKSSVVKNALSIRAPMGQHTLVRDVIATGKPIPLRDYNAKETRKGVTFRVVKSGGRKVYQMQGKPGFIVKKLGGHVFGRHGVDPPGPARAPIRKAYGPSITHRFGTKFIRNRMDQIGRSRWPIEFDREMKFRSSRNK
jgi:hypothetical protein